MMCGARFDIVAAAEPSVLCRLLGMLAQLGHVPATVHARCRDDRLRIVIHQPDMPEHAARIVAEKMRSSVAVCSVELMPADRLAVQ